MVVLPRSSGTLSLIFSWPSNIDFTGSRRQNEEGVTGSKSASVTLDLGLVEGARDTTWILELERAITVRQITDRMDPWTKKAWQARQFGYSWKEIATWAGLSEQAAKKKFEYGLEKTRQRICRLLKAERASEPS
jgi:AraC-like DNA-binding protein